MNEAMFGGREMFPGTMLYGQPQFFPDTPWSEEEHSRFLAAVERNGQQYDWNLIAVYVGTRNAAQVQQHATLYFMALQRQMPPFGTGQPTARLSARDMYMSLGLYAAPGLEEYYHHFLQQQRAVAAAAQQQQQQQQAVAVAQQQQQQQQQQAVAAAAAHQQHQQAQQQAQQQQQQQAQQQAQQQQQKQQNEAGQQQQQQDQKLKVEEQKEQLLEKLRSKRGGGDLPAPMDVATTSSSSSSPLRKGVKMEDSGSPSHEDAFRQGMSIDFLLTPNQNKRKADGSMARTGSGGEGGAAAGASAQKVKEEGGNRSRPAGSSLFNDNNINNNGITLGSSNGSINGKSSSAAAVAAAAAAAAIEGGKRRILPPKPRGWGTAVDLKELDEELEESRRQLENERLKESEDDSSKWEWVRKRILGPRSYQFWFPMFKELIPLSKKEMSEDLRVLKASPLLEDHIDVIHREEAADRSGRGKYGGNGFGAGGGMSAGGGGGAAAAAKKPRTQNQETEDDSSLNWVQCDRCSKWRRLPDWVDMRDIQRRKRWVCEDNPDKKRAKCSIAEPKHGVAAVATTTAAPSAPTGTTSTINGTANNNNNNNNNIDHNNGTSTATATGGVSSSSLAISGNGGALSNGGSLNTSPGAANAVGNNTSAPVSNLAIAVASAGSLKKR